MVNVFLIGAGRSGTELLDRLLHLNYIKVKGVADINPKALGMALAEIAGISVFTGDPIEALLNQKVDIVFDFTGDPLIGDRLFNLPKRTFNIMNSESSLPLFGKIKKLEVEDDRMQRRFKEDRILSEVSQTISQSKTSDQIFETIVNGAMKIAGMPAGSLSIFNPETMELSLVYAKGFSSEFYQNTTYKIRRGGLNDHILSKRVPIVVPDISDSIDFTNPILLREEIKSLIAIPINSEKGPVGILYVDDFNPRNFSNAVVEALNHLAVLASISIQKQQTYEHIKAFSIRDPVTGLFNRKYLNEILATEMKRAFHLGRPLSIIAIDIDHFDQIHDRLGNLTTDQVLKDLVSLFRPSIRRYDTFSRFEENMLLVLMADTDEVGVKIMVDRLLGGVASSKLLPDGSSLTCSFGICCLKGFEFPRPSLDDFLNRAKKALNEAKRLGGNQAYYYHPNLLIVRTDK